MDKVFYITVIVLFMFLMYFGLMAAGGSFFTIVLEESYLQKPIHYYPKSNKVYDSYVLGIFPVVVETYGETDCKVMMIDGPITKVEKKIVSDGLEMDYSGYHLLVETSKCYYPSI